MKRTFAVLFAAAAIGLAVTPATAGDYDAYAGAIQAQAQAAADAETARVTSIADIAASGSDAVKIASIMAIQGGAAAAPRVGAVGIAPPQDKLLAWGSLLIPALTNGYSAYLGAGTQRAQIEANTIQHTTTFNTLGGIAGAGITAAAKDPVIVHGVGVHVTQGGVTSPAPGSYAPAPAPAPVTPVPTE